MPEPDATPAPEPDAAAEPSEPAARDLPPELAKYLAEPPSLRDYETATPPSRLRFPRTATATAAPVPGPGTSSVGSKSSAASSGLAKRGAKDRTHAESWARGLTMMAAGMAVLAIMNTAAAVILGMPPDRPVLSWLGAGLIFVASRSAHAAVGTEREAQAPEVPFWRPGIGWVIAGLAVFFLVPQALRLL